MEAVKDGALFAALSAFRSATTVGKSGKNPMFKSEYTTLGDVLAALSTLQEYDLAFEQHLHCNSLITTVFHLGNGASFSSDIELKPEKDTPQSFISCLTYYRRASLMTMFGLNASDDDGNMASGRGVVPSLPRRAGAGGSHSSDAAPAPLSTDNLVLQLDGCKSVRDVNALYTKLFASKGIKISDSELNMFKQRKGELADG